jgi:hypothetical protein
MRQVCADCLILAIVEMKQNKMELMYNLPIFERVVAAFMTSIITQCHYILVYTRSVPV